MLVDIASRIPGKPIEGEDGKTKLNVFTFFQASFPEHNVSFRVNKVGEATVTSERSIYWF